MCKTLDAMREAGEGSRWRCIKTPETDIWYKKGNIYKVIRINDGDEVYLESERYGMCFSYHINKHYNFECIDDCKGKTYKEILEFL